MTLKAPPKYILPPPLPTAILGNLPVHDFAIGAFVVNEREYSSALKDRTRMYLLWRIDVDKSMQKYTPLRHSDGVIRHQAQPAVCRTHLC